MKGIPDNSIALVVTSPPYFVGKLYEIVGQGQKVPKSFKQYLRMLEAVFLECFRVLEPGGRIAVNVANLGRKPYRSLSADVIGILQQHGFLLRGEIIWVKAKGASGSVAWGSYMKASNPVLRDVTERVIVASKGRFDRAPDLAGRKASGLPHVSTITREAFMEATLDTWYIAPANATKLKHAAPFPVELPRRLIEMHTYFGDTVLDPFMGSGTTAVAAVETGRHFVGYDLNRAYVAAARVRVAQAILNGHIAASAAPAKKAAKAVAKLPAKKTTKTAVRAVAKAVAKTPAKKATKRVAKTAR
jgi:site-specific DNA-methyltransferase (adenine-specific)